MAQDVEGLAVPGCEHAEGDRAVRGGLERAVEVDDRAVGYRGNCGLSQSAADAFGDLSRANAVGIGFLRTIW